MLRNIAGEQRNSFWREEGRRQQQQQQQQPQPQPQKRQRNPFQKQPSPIIDEEEPITESTFLLKTDNGGSRPLGRKPFHHRRSFANSEAHRRHRLKHELRKHKRSLLLQQQQQRQEERERAVLEVRGKVQPTLGRKRDRFWSVLFLLQLSLVLAYAVKNGFTFYRSSSSSSMASFRDGISTIAAPSIRSAINPRMGPSAMMMLNPSHYNRFDDVASTSDNDGNSNSKNNNNNNDGDDDGDNQDEAFTIDYKNVLSLLLISGMYAVVTSYLSFTVMLIMDRSIIPIMLVFTILLMLCWGVFGLTFNTTAGSVISSGGFAVFGMSFVYTLVNWNHIPFCSTNLFAAICAMRSSIGILFLGVVSLFVGLLWLLMWTVALVGIFNRNNSFDCELLGDCETHVSMSRDDRIIEVGLLIVSLYWTTMVIKNIVRVAVAGAIGGPWWFGVEVDVGVDVDVGDNNGHNENENDNDYDNDNDNENEDIENQNPNNHPNNHPERVRLYRVVHRNLGCCPKSIVSDPLIRACTSSFGTICFGSLVELPAQILSKLVACLCWIIDSVEEGDSHSHSQPVFGEHQHYIQHRRHDHRRRHELSSKSLSQGSLSSTGSSGFGDDETDDTKGNRDESGLPEHTTSTSTTNTSTTSTTTTTTTNTMNKSELAKSDTETSPCGFKAHLYRLDRFLRSCNRWSYIYIGLYNYSFCEGGEKAIQLFETREWMDIASDTLIQNILLMTSTVIGGLTGMFSVVVEEVDGYEFTSLHKPIATSFSIGFVLGFLLSNILLLGLAGAAVNTVLVCFAAEPFEFDRAHPHLSREMRDVWSQQVWEPDETGGG